MIPEERDTSDVNNQHPPGYHNANTHPDLNICIPRLPRGGSPCLSLEQLFDADAFSLATSSTFGNHSDPTYANADVAKDLFGGDGPRRSRLDGWAPSHHALSTSPSPLHPHGSWNLESFPSTPDSYSEVGDFSSSSSYAALDWMHHPHSHPFNYNSAYSGSSGLNSGLTSPASCFSLDEEWAATSNARWFGPLCDTPGQTRPPSPGLQLSRTLSLPDAEYHSGRRTSVTQDLEQPFPLDLVQAESPKAVEVPQPHQNSINPTLEVPFVSQQEQTEAAPSSCSGFGLDPAAIFGQEPCQNHALPDSPSPTQISLPSSDNEGTSYEQQAAGLWTGLSSVTLNERNTSIPYASELSNVKEEKNEDKLSPATPKGMAHNFFGDARSHLNLNTSASSSGPRRHGRARRATISVMEAPLATYKKSNAVMKPTSAVSASSDVADHEDVSPMHWESQTTMATKMAAIARRKQGSEARFVCPFCAETFTRAYNLKGHIRAHKGERPFACDHPGCEKAFARHHDLKRHAELHLSQNRFKCASCKKGFRKIELLKRHYASEDSCSDPYPFLDDANAELYLAALTPIPSGGDTKGHKKSRSTTSLSRRASSKPVKFDDDADFTGGF